ncbi:hypothetical protein EC2719100_0455 [Escherichia coli 2719100]|nr:hypothetical protein ECP03018671_0419 [Escherichia coli P0301867.1]EMX91388.1 hypothetical protein EC2719100_0455 [Escherichia coli 2719100]ENA29463.1 hypothetical protein ECP03018674_4858 [Escherichia coli P0301867.4]ENA43729.1 hypothetical protein ECP03018672_3381 [Escherichia coli P0301867.2]ENA55332.1 hypothetical protein EC178900_4727 [Escherichia coli 178900]ENC87670.1 hypothetical protein ECP030186711_4929 [Escherichia coli P0301867.11]END16868.1 hypothetical protein ECP03018678_537
MSEELTFIKKQTYLWQQAYLNSKTTDQLRPFILPTGDIM